METSSNRPELTGGERLPDYQRPPVIETVLGVQFERLPAFKNAHLGGFWKVLAADEWPSVADAIPIPPQFERFPAAAKWAQGAKLRLTDDLSSRLQIKNARGDRMIQVQNGRLHFNWVRQADGEYPRYDTVRRGFAETLELFIRFLDNEGVGDFRPNQWEVTYLNHIPKGSVWNSPCDWRFLRLLGDVPEVAGLERCESITGEWHFALAGQRGRLHVAVHPGKTSSPEQEVVVLNLTARGPIDETDDVVESVLQGTDRGHAAIVRAFAGFTSHEANLYWGRKDVRK